MKAESTVFTQINVSMWSSLRILKLKNPETLNDLYQRY